MDEDRSRGEGVFEVLEGGMTGVTEVPGNTVPLQMRWVKGVTILE